MKIQDNCSSTWYSRRQCTFLSKTDVWKWSCLTFRFWFGKVVQFITYWMLFYCSIAHYCSILISEYLKDKKRWEFWSCWTRLMLVWFFRTVHRFKNKRYSSSANSSGGLEPLAEDVNFKLARLYEDGPTPDQGILLVFFG